ncbi:MAG: ankyrin repeat domain-containing protein, partial [Deferribacteraceae bacterium]|nr:ankyrin repeat domain-containing protein [Deferribacteraceae bacterium]
MEFFNFCANNRLADAQKRYAEGGVDLGFTDPGGRTALAFSAGKGHLDVVKWLIEIGSPLETKDNDGRTALARAAINDHLVVMETLIAAGADINAINKGQTPILSDCVSSPSSAKERAAILLLQSGADRLLTDDRGKSPLHYAVQAKLLNLTKLLLLDGGVDVNALDKFGNSPLYYAEQARLSNIIPLLKEAISIAPAPTPTETVAPVQATTTPQATTPPATPASATSESSVYGTFQELYAAIKYDNRTTPAIRLNSIVNYILNGGDINERLHADGEVVNFLEMAISFNIPELIKFVFDSGFDLTATPPEGGVKYYLKKFIDRYLWHEALRPEELAYLLPLFFDTNFELTIDEIVKMGDHKLSNFTKYYPEGVEPDNSVQKSYYKLILGKYPNINEVDRSGKSLLHRALEGYSSTYQRVSESSVTTKGEPNAPEFNYSDLWINAILDVDGVDLNLADYENYSPLYYACKKGSAEVVRKLVQMGATIDFLSGKDSMPLSHVACLAGRSDLLDVLLDFGLDVNSCNDKGVSLLLAAVSGAQHRVEKAIVALLLDKGADPYIADNQGNTPLHKIVTLRSDTRIVDGLLKWGGKKRDLLDKEILEIVCLLIDNGADLEAVNSNGFTPFASCCRVSANHQFKCTELPLVKYLIDRGAIVDTQDSNGRTPLYRAVDDDDAALVDILLAAGANSDLKANDGKTPYMHAVDKNRRAIISKIEKATASLEMDGDDMDAAFMRACKNGNRGVAEMLVKSGNIDVTYVDDEGRTPLHYIAKLGMTSLAKFVLENGVDINYADKFHQTALHFAAGNKQKEMLKFLLSNGANMNIADKDGMLAIHLVANRGQHDMLELFLDQGADANALENDGDSLLHSACHTRSRECVRVLLEKGVNPNILNKEGITPLVLSVNINQKEIVKMLIAAGADVKVKDIDGDEAIHIAAMR